MLMENQGSSSPITSLPTQCYFDTILIPLPTWILVLLAFIIFPIFIRRDFVKQFPGWQVKKRWWRIALHTVYYFCIAVVMLMESVEIARLVQIEYGIGLLPFVYAGCVIAAVLQASSRGCERLQGWQIANLLFWILSLAVTSVKLASLGRLSMTSEFRRDETVYSIPHQVNDLAIEVAFFAILAGLEVGLMLQKSLTPTPSAGVHSEELELKSSSGV
jgi:hypothetical protein